MKSRRVKLVFRKIARPSGLLMAACLLVSGAFVSACSSNSSSDSPAAAGGKKLLIVAMPVPCNFIESFATMCDGMKKAAAALPGDYELVFKTGNDYSDTAAFNSLIETSLQLKPAGMIVMPTGPSAQTAAVNKACDQGVKVIVIDTPAEGIKCQSAIVGADHHKLGAIMGDWLGNHAPSSKQVGIVSFAPGVDASMDARVAGFKEAAEAAGFDVVATASTDLSLEKSRTQTTNLLTAHPGLGAVFAANGPIGQGASQAVHSTNTVLLTLDLDSRLADLIRSGRVAAVGDQGTAAEGSEAVDAMAKLLQRKQISSTINTPLTVVDKDNVDTFTSGG
ncbi:ABC-type sugar transport system substrate-binding protein [Marmoricola sp. URHA0025 HA25]